MRAAPYEPLAAQVKALADPIDHGLALAMMNQARIRSSPIDAQQVIHLLAIGHRAGFRAGMAAARASEDE